MDDYSFVWHGENVTVYGYDLTEADACGGSFAEIDGHTGMIMEALGIRESANYTYRWIAEDYWSDTFCPPGAFACLSDGEALARTLPEMHEVVHMVTRSIGRNGCPSVLDEGLAMYYDGPGNRWDAYPSTGVDILPLLTAKRIPMTVDAYMRAGHFVSFLIEGYGPDAVVQLCNAIPRESSTSHWGAAVSGILGVGLDQLLSEYENYPECSSSQIRARLWGCNGIPDFAFTDGNGEFVVDAGCSDSQATNAAWGSLGDGLLLRRVYFPEDTWVEVSARSMGESGSDATYVSQECAPCSEDPQVLVELDDSDVQFYRAGLHEVSVFFDKRDSIRLTMTALP